MHSHDQHDKVYPMTSDLQLSSAFLRLVLDRSEGGLSLLPADPHMPRIRGASIHLSWRADGAPRAWSMLGQAASVEGLAIQSTVHGRCETAKFSWTVEPGGLRVVLEAALPEALPMFLWRLHILNQSTQPIRLQDVTLLHLGWRSGVLEFLEDVERGRPSAHGGRFRAARRIEQDLRFYTNGWQSWNFSGSLGRSDRFPQTRLGPLTRPMRTNPGTPRSRRTGHFLSEFFSVLGDRQRRKGILIGLLSERQAFGTIEAHLDRPRLRLWAHGDGVLVDPALSFTTDWACVQLVDLESTDPLAPYLEAVARENIARREAPTPVGWCSWYQYFEQVTQDDLLSNAAWIRSHQDEIPLPLVQLDDGYEAEVGDWRLRKDGFPVDLGVLSAEIRSGGLRPGLWLAPFVAKPRARVVLDHPHWILRTASGRPVNPGFIWDSFARALDVTHPEVLQHTEELIRTAVSEWGFDYLKLDFLYAGALAGKRHDPRLTRAQGLRRALERVREAAGETTTLVGCGCPLGPGVGLFDVMRVGPDVAPRWQPAHRGIELFLRSEEGHPSARNAVSATMGRMFLHRRWWVNDPDCLILRANDTHLTQDEAQVLATVASLSAGSLIVSDDLVTLTQERRAWLARLLPPLPSAARVVDWFDEAYPSTLVLPLTGPTGSWWLVARLNWGEQPMEGELDLPTLGIPEASTYCVLDVWNSHCWKQGSRAIELYVPSHGVRLLSVRVAPTVPQWIGDTLHVSSGLGVKEWHVEADQLRAVLELGRRAQGTVWLHLGSEPRSVMLGDQPLGWNQVGPQIFAIDCSFAGRSELRVSWG